MTELRDDNGRELIIASQAGPHRGIKATIRVDGMIGGLEFTLDEASCRAVRDAMIRLLDWDNNPRTFEG